MWRRPSSNLTSSQCISNTNSRRPIKFKLMLTLTTFLCVTTTATCSQRQGRIRDTNEKCRPEKSTHLEFCFHFHLFCANSISIRFVHIKFFPFSFSGRKLEAKKREKKTMSQWFIRAASTLSMRWCRVDSFYVVFLPSFTLNLNGPQTTTCSLRVLKWGEKKQPKV